MPTRTRARMFPSSLRAERSSQPPPQPQVQPAASCRITRSRLPATVTRSWKARRSSASVIVSSEPDAGRPIRPPPRSWSAEERRARADESGRER